MTAGQLAAFTESVTHTVLHFRRDGGEYENTVTGEIGYSGNARMDCGHVTRWLPLGEHMPSPRRGDRLVCGPCLDAALTALQPT